MTKYFAVAYLSQKLYGWYYGNARTPEQNPEAEIDGVKPATVADRKIPEKDKTSPAPKIQVPGTLPAEFDEMLPREDTGFNFIFAAAILLVIVAIIYIYSKQTVSEEAEIYHDLVRVSGADHDVENPAPRRVSMATLLTSVRDSLE